MVLFETINTVSIVLFVAGIALLVIEMFIPGFGIFGGLGVIALILSVIFQASTVAEALIMVVLIGAIIALFLLVILRSFRKGRIYKSSIVLKNSAVRSEGYVSNDDYSRLLGMRGKSVTVLRPSGLAEFGGEKVDVVTDGEFLPKGADVEVTAVAGRRIAVREAQGIDKEAGIDIPAGGDNLNM
jgi:membrane-bound ClpP family serine protease